MGYLVALDITPGYMLNDSTYACSVQFLHGSSTPCNASSHSCL